MSSVISNCPSSKIEYNISTIMKLHENYMESIAHKQVMKDYVESLRKDISLHMGQYTREILDYRWYLLSKAKSFVWLAT
jgi:hypothetical protein